MAVKETPRKSERFLRLNILQLSLLGVWRIPPALRIITTTLVLCMAGLLVGDLRLCYLAGSDLQELSKAVAFLMAHSMSFTKWTFLFRNRRALEGILHDMNTCIDLGFQAKRGDERTALEVYGKSLSGRWRLAKWVNSFWFLTLSYTMTHWCVSVLFVRIPLPPNNSTNITEYGRVFPLGDWQIVDSQHTPGYESLFFTQSVAAIGHAWSHGAFDGLYASLSIFLCGCFEFLADIVLEVGEDKAKFKDLASAIKFHQALLRVAKDVDNMFSFIMFVQMINLVLALCTFAFQASTIGEDGDTNLMSALQVVTCGIIQLLIFCTFTTELTWMSWKVADSAYDSLWIDKPLPWKRCIQLVMHRAQLPLRFTGGAFYFICLETFVAILQLSFSYFMVLRTLHENNQQTESFTSEPCSFSPPTTECTV